MTPTEAIQNALDFIESYHGHRDGALYEDLAEALEYLKERHPRTMAIDLTKEVR